LHMATAITEYCETVLLHDIPWEVFEAIDETLGEFHLRFTYNKGLMELRKVIIGVTWQDYERFLDAIGDFNLPHSYDHGELRLMSPRRDHDGVKTLIARLIETAAFELEIPIESLGSTTLAGKKAAVSIQPDEAYYVQNERKVRHTTDLDLKRDPPPDLALEVIVTHRAPYKMSFYAQLGVAEVWRYDGKKLEFFKLSRKTKRYRVVATSGAFPLISSDLIIEHLKLRKKLDEHSVVRSFIERITNQ